MSKTESQTKVCAKCKAEKSLDDFYRHNGADGRRPKCKDCMRVLRQSRSGDRS